MSRPQEKTFQPFLEEPMENVGLRPSLLRRLQAWRRALRRERTRQADDQLFAWRVQDIIVGLGLTQGDYSIGGGRALHIPEVVSVIPGPPAGVGIRMLPGQMPDDFAKHAQAIAYNLGMAEVRVVPLGPSLIRLDLLPGPG